MKFCKILTTTALGLFLVGCASHSTHSFYFNSGSTTLNEQAKSEIAMVAKDIKKADSSKVKVLGFADKLGTKEVNRRISEQRAAAVKKQLVMNGVAPSKIKVKSYGESKQRVTTADNKDNKWNRRVEVEIH